MSTVWSTGLRNAMLTNNSYATNMITGTTYSFGDGTGASGADQILDSGSQLVTDGIGVVGAYVSVDGSTSNNVDGLKISAATEGAIDVPAGSFSTEAAGDQVILGLAAGGGSLDELLRNGIIEIYTGTQPSTADLAETGTKLVRITISSGAFTPGTGTNGLNLATAASGVTSKESTEVWSGVGLAAGTAGWFRFYDNSYTTGASTTAVRFDGVCGVGTGQLQLSSLSIAVGATITVDTGSITFSASAS